jgi:hypothetical protein
MIVSMMGVMVISVAVAGMVVFHGEDQLRFFRRRSRRL